MRISSVLQKLENNYSTIWLSAIIFCFSKLGGLYVCVGDCTHGLFALEVDFHE